MASNQDGSLIMTGSVDCHAKLVNSSTGKVGPCWLGQSQEPRGTGVTAFQAPVLGQASVPGWFGLRWPRAACGGHRQPAGGALGQHNGFLPATGRTRDWGGSRGAHRRKFPALFAPRS